MNSIPVSIPDEGTRPNQLTRREEVGSFSIETKYTPSIGDSQLPVKSARIWWSFGHRAAWEESQRWCVQFRQKHPGKAVVQLWFCGCAKPVDPDESEKE